MACRFSARTIAGGSVDGGYITGAGIDSRGVVCYDRFSWSNSSQPPIASPAWVGKIKRVLASVNLLVAAQRAGRLQAVGSFVYGGGRLRVAPRC